MNAEKARYAKKEDSVVRKSRVCLNYVVVV